MCLPIYLGPEQVQGQVPGFCELLLSVILYEGAREEAESPALIFPSPIP